MPLHLPPAGDVQVGRARGLPLRREGPDKLTGTALYTDDLVFPGAWFGHTVRSTEAHARLLGIDLDPDFDWSAVIVLTAKDIPGENLVSMITDDQPASTHCLTNCTSLQWSRCSATGTAEASARPRTIPAIDSKL